MTEETTETVEAGEAGEAGEAQPKPSAHRKSIQLASQDAYLAAFALSGEVVKSCRAAGVHHSTYYEWLQADAQGFKARIEEATLSFRESLQSRAIARIDDPKGNRGSDVLLMSMLNAWWPEKYRQTVIDTSSVAKDVLAELRRRKKAEREGKAARRERTEVEESREAAQELVERIRAKRSG